MQPTTRYATGSAGTDGGSAMIITLMVLALVTALSTTVAAVTINNLQSSMRAQQSGAAVGAADAGLAQAMSYLRNSGVRALKCTDDVPVVAACTNSWGSANPVSVAIPGKAGQAYKVWIEAVKPFPTDDGSPGRYRIHSTGTAAGDAARQVVTDVAVRPIDVPLGIFARTVDGGGSASVTRESIFSSGCVFNRARINMEGMDVAYDIPAAAHSSEIITDSTGSGQYCPDTNKPIHRVPHRYVDPQPCNDDYLFDQDRLGGAPPSGSPCESAQAAYPKYYGTRDFSGDSAPEVSGSLIKDTATLFRLFGIKSPALSVSEIDQIRSIAQAQGNYWRESASSAWTSPDEANAVMFFDLAQDDLGGTVDLNDVDGFGRPPNHSSDASCSNRSLIIVIEGGNAKLNSHQQLAASLFLLSSAPYGQVIRANGTSDFIGTIYADGVNLTGNTEISLDECFLANVSPALLSFQLGAYRELDR